jgi:plasmid maintenance system antidote protein VapI
MALEGFKALRAKAQKSTEYWQEVGLSEFLSSLRQQMERKRMRPVDLANEMRVSRPYISKVLSGEDNLTFATMVRLAMAAGGVVHVHVADRNAVTTWNDRGYSRIGRRRSATSGPGRRATPTRS